MPIDLWVSITGRTQPSGSESTSQASVTLATISGAISQCSTTATRE